MKAYRLRGMGSDIIGEGCINEGIVFSPKELYEDYEQATFMQPENRYWIEEIELEVISEKEITEKQLLKAVKEELK
jgi:hypothetical protein